MASVFDVKLSKAKSTMRGPIPYKDGLFIFPDTKLVVCGNCQATWPSDAPKVCECMFHDACKRYWRPHNSYPSIKTNAPKCGQSQHCCLCCTCVVCVKCKKIQLTPAITKKPRLGAKKSPLCGLCKVCHRCCGCFKCETCGEKMNAPQACACTRGAKHHSQCCEKSVPTLAYEAPIHYINRSVRFHESLRFITNRSHRMLANEIEIASTTGTRSLHEVNKVGVKWGHSIVTDASLPHGGFEINTSPANGDKFLEQMQDIASALALADPVVTDRCGMHTHVDARDFSYSHLINLITLYNKIEVALYALLPPIRRMTKYAIPCRHVLAPMLKGADSMVKSDPDFELKRWLDANYSMKLKDKKASPEVLRPKITQTLTERLYGSRSSMNQRTVKRPTVRGRAPEDTVRYWGLNLHSWYLRKTIEFRMFPGTYNYEEMTMWPQLLAAILDAAAKWPLDTIRRLPPNPLDALMCIMHPQELLGKKYKAGMLFGVNPRLGEWIEARITRFSPHFDTDFELISKLGGNAVNPLPMSLAHGGYLGWNAVDGAYTYNRHTEHRGEPIRNGGGRLATYNDLAGVLEPKLIAKAKESGVSWLSTAPPVSDIVPPEMDSGPEDRGMVRYLDHQYVIRLRPVNIPVPFGAIIGLFRDEYEDNMAPRFYTRADGRPEDSQRRRRRSGDMYDERALPASMTPATPPPTAQNLDTVSGITLEMLNDTYRAVYDGSAMTQRPAITWTEIASINGRPELATEIVGLDEDDEDGDDENGDVDF